MSRTKTIEIDFDIHRLIELERRGFDEPENAALRRLLNLPALEIGDQPTHSNSPAADTAGRSWSGKGVTLPHGTELRMEYRGRTAHGVIDDGNWLVEGQRTTSPSDAAGSAVVTKRGERPTLNGWIYWEVKRPGDAIWRPLRALRTE